MLIWDTETEFQRRNSRFILCQAKREYSKLVSQEVFSSLQREGNQDMEIFSVPQNILQCPLLVSTILPTLELAHLHHHRLFLSVLELHVSGIIQYLACFTQCNVFELLVFLCITSFFLLLEVFHHLKVPQFVYIFFCCWLVELFSSFHFWPSLNKANVNTLL